MNFVSLALNITSVSPPTYYEMTKAKRAYRKLFPECAICGNRKYLEVHHVKPVHIYPNLACDPNNFITLCDAKNNSCHRWIGHFGNFRHEWNEEIREYALISRLLLQWERPTREFIISTDQMITHFAKAAGITESTLRESLEELSPQLSRLKISPQ